MRDFARRALLGLFALLPLLNVMPARGFPPRVAVPHRLTASVQAGDLITLACGRDPGPSPSGTVFGQYAVTDASGAIVSGGAAAISFWNERYAAVSVDEGRRTVVERSGPITDGFANGNGRVTPAPGTLRAGWAAWSVDARCIITVNGDELPWSVDANGEARFALASDFTEGVSASAMLCLSAGSILCPGAGPGVRSAYPTYARGYLFALLLPAPVGVLRARGPAGEDIHSIYPTNPIAVSKLSVGRWRFSIRAGTTDGGPVLWTISLSSGI
jgi:hypothetical protein